MKLSTVLSSVYTSLKMVRFMIVFPLIYPASFSSCSNGDSGEIMEDPVIQEVVDPPADPDPEDPTFKLPNIDLSYWKVTLPIGENGRPIEVEPPEILDYATNETLKPFMYNDSIEGSLVFYAYPGVSTPNSSRSRTELREQMVPGSNNTNWTFGQGGRMKGRLKVSEVSEDASGDPHRVIIMQIHGRLTNEQRDRIGEDDNNAPPVLKIYWEDNRVRVKTKVLKDPTATGDAILYTSAWEDDAGHYFSETVGFESFSLEVIASEGRLEVIMNDDESVVYEGIHMDKWGVFENYFKAGNYLQTSDEGAFARVKYFELDIEH